MEERQPGSYLEKKGKLTPNLEDEAMKARSQTPATPGTKEEVKGDA